MLAISSFFLIGPSSKKSLLPLSICFCIHFSDVLLKEKSLQITLVSMVGKDRTVLVSFLEKDTFCTDTVPITVLHENFQKR